MPIVAPHYIIAIGASAGGTEEINAFFDHTPLDGVSYIIVQHLSPDFRSQMAKLLSKQSKLVVKEAENGMKVCCNEVYLIPNNRFMTINGGNLYLTEKEKVKGPHLTINTFFKSLAAYRGHKSIGVILSGLGSDGTEGIRALKESGGMVIARNPATSAFGSMPFNAVSTGMVDFILEPAAMPDTIKEYIKNEEAQLLDIENDDKNLTDIIKLIKERSPLDFSDYKKSTILRRTKRRAQSQNFNALSNYLIFLKEFPDEIDALCKDFLISVTSFFRDIAAFEFIEKKVFPEILLNLVPGEELKLWVAGCATGEEAYSLAILICELLKDRTSSTRVKIFATDIDSTALAVARKGVYSSSIEKNISRSRIEKHFIRDGLNYQIKPEIRRMVIFAKHDLAKNPPYCNMQFITCRNLLIYMTPILQQKIYKMLLFGLKMGGYLFLGSSENPIPIIKNLEIVDKKWKIYRNVETKREINFDAFSIPNLQPFNHRLVALSPAHLVTDDNNFLAESMNQALAEEMEYLSVCINENHQVIKSYGDISKFLLLKHFTSNLTDLLPKPLAVAFKALCSSVSRTSLSASSKGIKIKHGQGIFNITLTISPLKSKGNQKLLMVTFREDRSDTSTITTDFEENLFLDHYTRNLEQEVKTLKEQLVDCYEKLDASNENMQSFSEELISANEEMQSTNEEMQSLNEELQTINTDYQIKNKELIEINDDLNNYFRSNVNGQLFINNELKLIKFSPGTVKQINLLETDIGRPLSNISTNIRLDTMIEDIKKVLKEGIVITKEIETIDGQWYQSMTMPYVQQIDNKNSGAIVTFSDITELKTSERELDRRNKALLRINTDLDHFIHAASHDLLAPLSNIESSIKIMNDITDTEPKLIDLFNVIDISVKKFRELIMDIATIARIEHDTKTQEKVDLEKIIDNIEWSLENKIAQTGAIITRSLEIKHLYFSKKNIRSILFNLVSNAIKFNRGITPRIHISTLKTGDEIILSVQDNGKGIPKDGMKKIFEVYGRLNNHVEGSGIGLYLARKIVNAAGGNLLLESEYGVGSKFIIHLRTDPEHFGIPSSLASDDKYFFQE